MSPSDVAPAVVAMVFLIMGGLTLILRGPLGKAIARRFEGGLPLAPETEARLQELEARVAELEHERHELAERVDFAERLLAQGRDARELPR